MRFDIVGFGLGRPNLPKLREKRDVRGLIRALGYTEDYRLRSGAAKALGEIGDARAVEPLIGALSDDDKGVRKNAADALGKIGDARAVEPLMLALDDSVRMFDQGLQGPLAVSAMHAHDRHFSTP